MTTNANIDTAAALSTLDAGRFASLTITKKGKECGRGADRKVYGNDRVKVTVITKFSYENLVRRSLESLRALNLDEFASAANVAGATDADWQAAYDESVASFERTLEGTNSSPTDDVFEPLVVDGETVRGCRVYTGDKAEEVGTVYLQGLAIDSEVITPAPNGPKPAVNSKPKTLCKVALRRNLPVSRYVSYVLAPNGDWELRAGGAVIDAFNARTREKAAALCADLDG